MKQIEYILQLSIDLQFNIKTRDAHIKEIVGREAKPDALFEHEADTVIRTFRRYLGREEE